SEPGWLLPRRMYRVLRILHVPSRPIHTDPDLLARMGSRRTVLPSWSTDADLGLARRPHPSDPAHSRQSGAVDRADAGANRPRRWGGRRLSPRGAVRWNPRRYVDRAAVGALVRRVVLWGVVEDRPFREQSGCRPDIGLARGNRLVADRRQHAKAARQPLSAPG